MLEQILDFIHNYFEKEIVYGTFTISSGDIGATFLQDGQYFRIVGSVFNDGVHKYEPNNESREQLTDETFEGQVWAMAVPPAVIALSVEITNWNSTNGGDSPFVSESFGGYSYTKGTSSRGGGATTPLTWKDVFRDRLNHWRKII